MTQFNCSCSDSISTTTLSQLRSRMLIRLGFAAQVNNPPPGMELLINDFLQDAQKQMYEKYPALRTERYFTWTMTPGERFYGLKSNDEQTPGDSEYCTKILKPERISWVGFEDLQGAFQKLVEGIDPIRYTSLINTGWPDSYEIRQCIEIFPAPQAAYKLIVKGHYGLLPFSADGDVTTIDEHLVFLLALANAKSHYNQRDANLYFSQATSHLGDLISGTHGTARYVPGPKPAPPEAPPVFLPLQS